jgi:8-oxo-dGTP pyrophosphatase MutT (NUDIX family)
MPGPGDELVDIVDEHDNVVAVVTRREMRAKALRHRAVFIAVQHSDGRLLVHQRSFAKDLRPGAWDIAFGGVVAAGESYDDAAVRELAEEIGIAGTPLRLLSEGSYHDTGLDLVARCYHVVHDGPFHFADGEVIATRWVDRAGLDRVLADEDVMPDSIALMLGHLDVAP